MAGLACLLSATTGCGGVRTEAEGEATITAQKLDTPAWAAIWDYAGADLDSVAATHIAAGNQVLSISAYGGNGSSTRYAAVFVSRAGAPWKVKRGDGLTSFQNEFNAEAAANYKVTQFSFDGSATNPAWVAVFSQSSNGIPLTRSALTSGSVTDQNTIQYWLNQARINKWMPSTLSIYGTSTSQRYAVVLEPNTNNVEWSADGLMQSSDMYQQTMDAQNAAWNRPALLEVASGAQYIAMYRDDNVGPWAARHNLDSAGVSAMADEYIPQGYFPLSIHGGGSGSNLRYATLWAKSELPQSRTFTSQGSGASFDSNISSIDNVMKNFMVANNVRQASLGVVSSSKRKLVYARGYTYAEPGYPITNPATEFRLASVSKVATAMAILKLVDNNSIKLTDTVQSILNLKTLTGGSPPSSFGTITLQHLLTHQYPTLGTASSPKCLLRDGHIGQEVASAFNVSLPVTLNQSVTYSISQTSELVRSPDSNGSCYSNFAYNLLAQVVEKKHGGTAYQTDVATDIFTPLKMTHYRIGVSDAAAQPSLEAIYRAANLPVVSSVGTSSGKLVSTAYGGDNFNAMIGASGWSMAAPDVARLVASLNQQKVNPIYQDVTTTDGDPTTISQILGNPPLGFDGILTGNHYYKGGLMPGNQSKVYFTKDGLTYVLLWARDNVPNSGNAADVWFPNWPSLENVMTSATLDSRTDLFPTYGMPSFDSTL